MGDFLGGATRGVAAWDRVRGWVRRGGVKEGMRGLEGDFLKSASGG